MKIIEVSRFERHFVVGEDKLQNKFFKGKTISICESDGSIPVPALFPNKNDTYTFIKKKDCIIEASLVKNNSFKIRIYQVYDFSKKRGRYYAHLKKIAEFIIPEKDIYLLDFTNSIFSAIYKAKKGR